MHAEQPMYGCVDLSRRAFLLTPLAVLSTPTAVTATDGFAVTGEVAEAAGDGDLFYLGSQFGLIAAPGSEPARLLSQWTWKRVRVHVELL